MIDIAVDGSASSLSIGLNVDFLDSVQSAFVHDLFVALLCEKGEHST